MSSYMGKAQGSVGMLNREMTAVTSVKHCMKTVSLHRHVNKLLAYLKKVLVLSKNIPFS